MSFVSPGFDFGSFRYFCQVSPLAYCSSMGFPDPKCYSRNIDFGGFLLFQPAVLVIDIAALIMTLVMIRHIKRKYTAVGRKEMVLFFYMYAACVLLDLILAANFVPVGTKAYNYFVALQLASVSTTFWILLLNGFVGFQWAEDGTKKSLWSFRISGTIVFAIVFLISLFTFNGIAGLNASLPLPLFIIIYIFNAAIFLIYVFLQIVLVIKTLEDRWPVGVILLGGIFFIISQAILIVLSSYICHLTGHYVDGTFFSNLFILLSVMMVYKYWSSITKEDLEFSLGAPITSSSNGSILKKDTWSHMQNTCNYNEYGGI
jgi:hypothetical protein